jgi:hypothetical protein
MRAAILAAALAVTALSGQERPKFKTETVEGLACLELKVTPRIMLPLTRTDVRVELRIRRHSDHRQWSLAWDGGLAGGGSSAAVLRGEDEPFLHTRTLRDVPAAGWQFVAAVFDGKGKITGRQVAEILLAGVD